MWPVSWASTPITWFGVSASMSVPALMKMRRPSATNALNERWLMITTWMFCCARPAAFRIGWVYSRSNCSISASRTIGGPACLRAWACAGDGPATQWLAAIASETATASGREGRLAMRCDRLFGQGHADLKFRARGPGRPAAGGFVAAIDNTPVCRAHPAWNWPHCAWPGKLIPRSRPHRWYCNRSRRMRQQRGGRSPCNGRLNRCWKRRNG